MSNDPPPPPLSPPAPPVAACPSIPVLRLLCNSGAQAGAPLAPSVPLAPAPPALAPPAPAPPAPEAKARLASCAAVACIEVGCGEGMLSGSAGSSRGAFGRSVCGRPRKRSKERTRRCARGRSLRWGELFRSRPSWPPGPLSQQLGERRPSALGTLPASPSLGDGVGSFTQRGVRAWPPGAAAPTPSSGASGLTGPPAAPPRRIRLVAGSRSSCGR